MNNTSTFLLESKLKRLKISFAKENGNIVIGKSKIDLVALIVLIFFPIALATGAIVFMSTSELDFSGSGGGKIWALIIFLFAVGIVNGFRLMNKSKANKLRKILGHKTIKIQTKETILSFDANNIKDFEHTITQVDNEIFAGNLFLVDTNNNKHLLLGFDDENEQYVLDDLFWFSDYFKKHVEL